MRIFLTGATGFAGSEVRTALANGGHSVTAIVRRAQPLENCRTIIGDLSAPEGLREAVREAEAVVHLACSREMGQAAVESDVAGTAFLLDEWKRGPFIASSTGSLQIGRGVPLKEDMPLFIHTGYGFGKFCNEFQVRMATATQGRGPGVSLRPGVLFGAGARRNDRQILGLVYKHCVAGTKFLFYSEEGLELYGSSFLGTEDFGRAVASALTLKESGAFNVASGFCTWRQLVETINRMAGTAAQCCVNQSGPPDAGEYALPQARRCLDDHKFRQQTGFKPKQELEELVEAYLKAERG